jgi:hypothetical protein
MPTGTAQTAARPPLTSPPAWWMGTGGEGGAGPGPSGEGPIPGPGWPAPQTVDYLTKLIVLGLLLLAIPWLLAKLIQSPREGSRHAAAAAMGSLGTS